VLVEHPFRALDCLLVGDGILRAVTFWGGAGGDYAYFLRAIIFIAAGHIMVSTT